MKASRRARAALAAAGVLLPLLAFVGLEAAARRAAPKAPAPASEEYLAFLRENGRPFFRRDGAELVQRPKVWKIDLDQRLALVKRAGVRRILVVGESSADLLGRELRRRLARDAGYEVVNMSVGAGSVEYVAKRYDEGLRLAPDAVVLFFGHNTAFRHPALPGLAALLEPLRRRSRLLYRLSSSPRDDHPRFGQEERLAALKAFTRRLTQDAARRGIPAVIVLPASNLRVAPGAGPTDTDDPEYLKALYDWDLGRRRQAAAELERALALRPSALWSWTLGNWLSSAELLARARDLDPKAMRADAAVAAALRESSAGALVIDGDALIRARAPRGIPGWESFSDVPHLRPAGIALLAERVLSALGAPAGKPAPPEPRSLRDDLDSVLAMTPLEDEHLWPTLTAFATWRLRELKDGAVLELGQSPERAAIARVCFAQALWDAGLRSQARASLQRARALRPGWSEPDMAEARLSLRQGLPGRAASALAAALRKDPSRPDARFYADRLAGRAP